ncbi:putative sensor domain DACNV-containing protein [Hymenobacter sp. CRA2]|uniref:putative sensor domain DACNV-containing protein n=1 Tax=Hymenobacter sp. CRA2 TaxID=1955620 RepID=UPI00098E87EE|nr:diadenylate cyclase [Hymenobacter sp. CRA2]OON69389.1 hypothetical protein B0919_08900 [Hymenobacter sp. CRA2]
MDQHYYPPDVAVALQGRWPAQGLPLPPLALLISLISVAYQASLLSEEGRPVHSHLIFLPPDQAVVHADNSHGTHVLALSHPRACNEQELRRLSPTVQRSSSLLAVSEAAQTSLQIWGMLLTSSPWEQEAEDGYAPADSLPPALVLHVRAPGGLVFYCGRTRVLTLQQGRIEGHGFLHFPAAWTRKYFTYNSQDTAEIAEAMVMHLLRRAITRVRSERHGGMLVLVPAPAVDELMGPSGLLRPKYRVQALGTGGQYSALFEAILQRTRQLGLTSWSQYQETADGALRALRQQLDEFAEVLADLMGVDGAAVLSSRLDVAGFGVEIHAPLISTNCVYRALDVDAVALRAEAVDTGGTRHRAAYRLCFASTDCLVIVVSQDGAVKFVRQREGKVVFWDQLAV